MEDFENHYNARHTASCSVCSRVYPTSRLLSIHVSETHDSFFQAKVARGYDMVHTSMYDSLWYHKILLVALHLSCTLILCWRFNLLDVCSLLQCRISDFSFVYSSFFDKVSPSFYFNSYLTNINRKTSLTIWLFLTVIKTSLCFSFLTCFYIFFSAHSLACYLFCVHIFNFCFRRLFCWYDLHVFVI